MPRAATLLAAVVLCACGTGTPAVAPAAGTEIHYVQTFLATARTSGGEELPDVRVRRQATVTCSAAGEKSARLAVRYGDVSVWVDATDGEPALVATDAGAAERAFTGPDAEVDLGRLIAALWATTAHRATDLVVDRHGAVIAETGEMDDVRRTREDDAATDLGGALLESLLDDSGLLLPAVDAAGRRPTTFRLAAWNAAFGIAAAVTRRGDGAFALAYESAPRPGRQGPFDELRLTLSGDGSRRAADGLLVSLSLHLDVAALVPTGAGGDPRRDTAHLEYTLAEATE